MSSTADSPLLLLDQVIRSHGEEEAMRRLRGDPSEAEKRLQKIMEILEEPKEGQKAADQKAAEVKPEPRVPADKAQAQFPDPDSFLLAKGYSLLVQAKINLMNLPKPKIQQIQKTMANYTLLTDSEDIIHAFCAHILKATQAVPMDLDRISGYLKELDSIFEEGKAKRKPYKPYQFGPNVPIRMPWYPFFDPKLSTSFSPRFHPYKPSTSTKKPTSAPMGNSDCESQEKRKRGRKCEFLR